MTTEELITEQFYAWERRGRGWQVWDYPVEPEPPFEPFPGYYLPTWDDGRRPSSLSTWVEKLQGRHSLPEPDIDFGLVLEHYGQAEPAPLIDHSPLIEIQVSLPTTAKTYQETAERFLSGLRTSSMPVSFEVIGLSDAIVIQFTCREQDAALLRSGLKAFFPDSDFTETNDFLSGKWLSCSNGPDTAVVVDFGLSHEFVIPLPLANFSIDTLIGIVGSLSDVKDDETALLQVLFQSAQYEWANSAVTATTDMNGKSVFANAPQIADLLRRKLSYPLFAAVIRTGAVSSSKQRSWELVRRLGSALIAVFSGSDHTDVNELIPLSNDGYDDAVHEEDLFLRQTHRSGMLLNSAELLSFVHIPSPAVRSDKFKTDSRITKAAPEIAVHDPAANNVVTLGENTHADITRAVSLNNEQRSRHIHIIGSTGSGKSTFLLNLIKQDMDNSGGLCVLDPHGDLIDEAVANVPESRLDDVILFDPSDADYPVGFNILQANSDLEKTLLSSDLVATFRRMSTSWGDVMDSVLANAILALVESDRGGTLFDLKRFLVEKRFRDEFLETVNDDAIRYFWKNEFPLIIGKPQSSILIRLDAFLRQKLIRNIVCQKKTKLDFRRIMDDQKILLIKLSQGLIGKENSHLLGTLLVSKLYQTALSRQDTSQRPYYSIYLDEFQHFITPSMENILSGVRKFNIGLHVSHQEYRQIQSRSQDVASSVLSNCYTRVCFRLGDNDAEKFAGGFSTFDADALRNLGIGEAIVRVERSEYDFNLKVQPVQKVDRSIAEQRKAAITNLTREKYARPVSEVQTELFPASEDSVEGIKAEKEPSSQKINAVNQSTETTKKPSDTNSKSGKASANPKSVEPKTTTKETISIENVGASGTKDHKDSSHRYLQSVIKRIGENNGFVAAIEKQVFGGVGKIDVALENEVIKVACEIANTNTVDYEVQNIQKCLAAGFDKVVVISPDAGHLSNIRKKCEGLISSEQLSKVSFLEPEHFHLLLEKFKYESVSPKEEKVKGYAIDISVKENTEDAEMRRQAIVGILQKAESRK